MRIAALALILALTPLAAAAQDLAAATQAIRDKALADPTAYELVESLTSEVGARPTGSPAMTRAKDWGVAKLKALGFETVYVEEFQAGAWIRGAESAEVTGPYPHRLSILGLGRSPSTPKGGVEAEIAVFGSLDAMLAAPEGALKGKIAVVNQPMMGGQDGTGYGALGPARRRGAAEAAKRGAVAYLVRSLSAGTSRLPHTGEMNVTPGEPTIPAAALGVPDAELLARLARRGPTRVRLNLQSRFVDKVPAWNVVGEFKGSERPDEVIVVGGHLDSWDVGTGAVDDGAGIGITTAAARLVGQARPKRTIRLVMWGAEEMAYSGRAYAAAHEGEVGKMVVVGESDSGDGPIWRARLPKGSAGHPAMKGFLQAVAPLRVAFDSTPATSAGADVAGLVRLGAPPVALSPDTSLYWHLHHSDDDTFDKIAPEKLGQSVAVWTSFLYAVANSDIDFRKLAAEAP